MTCLSIRRNGGPITVVANPIFLLNDPIDVQSGPEIEFEILDADAGGLKVVLGTHQCFYIDNRSEEFWAQLKRLEPCVGSHPGLAWLSSKPTLRGVLAVVAKEGKMQH